MYVFVKDWRQGLEPFDPETEGKRSNTLMATRVLPTEFLDRVSDPLTLTEGNRAWEQQRPEGWAGLPGHDKDIAGTWVSPPTTPSLRMPDLNTVAGRPMSLVGIAGRKIMDSPEWHAKRANYEGFKYDGFDENKYRLLSQGFPGAENTTLEDLQTAAMYIDKPDKFDNVTNEQMRGLVNALKTAQIDGEDGNYVDDIDFVERHWAPSVTELPHYARTDYPRVLASEPMEIAMRLLKYDEGPPPRCSRCGRMVLDNVPEINDEMSPPAYNNPNICLVCEEEDEERETAEWAKRGGYDIIASEPMEIGNVLIKERVSPEAKRHKLEYDTKYESSPERVKYREDLNRERRKRGMYGDHSHRDISHTEGNKLTIEDEHSNRSRHFKDKGTLRSDTKKAGVAVKQPKPNDRKPIAVKEVGDYYA